MELVNRAQAKERGQSSYYTGKPCKHGHIAKRWTLDGTCSECKALRNKDWWDNNKERGRELIYKWRKDNLEKHREMINKAVKGWEKKNPGKRNSYTANRRAKIIDATPAWADISAIQDLYIKANKQGLQVDNIIPLNHPMVCGLHVETNMQLLSPLENQIKSNKFKEEYVEA